MIKFKFDESLGEYGKLVVSEGEIEYSALYAEKMGESIVKNTIAYFIENNGEIQGYDIKNEYYDDPYFFDGKTYYPIEIKIKGN